ncbi:MAG: sulfite exporter TauE/SafE family protein [Actinomycetota bacterium]|nr:sulfite exporter TauE/SafE family protein [Actinomycetota bacterium]
MQRRLYHGPRTAKSWLVPAGMGLVAGLTSGLLGVGGGIVMVPMLTMGLAFTQHRAHATSLAAIVPIAAVAAVTYAAHGEVDYQVAAFLATGSLVGAPLGARLMARSGEGALKAMFGILLLSVAIRILWP